MQPRYKVANLIKGEEGVTRKEIDRVVDQVNRALMDLYAHSLPLEGGTPTVQTQNLGGSITTTIINTFTSSYVGSFSDRLRTSGGSTVILTDNGTNQTLTGSLGELQVAAAGIIRFISNVTANGTLTVNGGASIGGGLAVTGGETIGGGLAVTGNAAVSGSITTRGSLTASSGISAASLFVSGNIISRGTITGEHLIDPDVTDVTSSRVIGTVYQNTNATMLDVRVSLKAS